MTCNAVDLDLGEELLDFSCSLVTITDRHLDVHQDELEGAGAMISDVFLDEIDGILTVDANIVEETSVDVALVTQDHGSSQNVELLVVN